MGELSVVFLPVPLGALFRHPVRVPAREDEGVRGVGDQVGQVGGGVAHTVDVIQGAPEGGKELRSLC